MAACILLALTAFDLTNPGFCALEGELELTNATVSATDNAGNVPSTSAAIQRDHRDPASPLPTNPPHVDDCFCCSHCVEVTPVPSPAGTPVALAILSEIADNAPRSTGRPLYHPPRI